MDAAGKAVSTRRSTFNALSALLADAKRDDLIARNPLDSLRRPTGRTAESRHLERDEALRLLAAARGDRFEALWIVMLSTGIRRGEAVGLEWSDVDLDGGTIRIRRTVSRVDGVGLLVGEPKTERGRRTIPLPPMAVESLRRHRTRQSEERLRSKVWYEPEVVFSTHHGTRLEPNNVSRALKALALHAGISGTISPHTLRHTFASTLLGEGEDLAVVSELLGHGSSVVTLTVYQHVLRRNRDRAAGRMEAFLSADNNSDNNAVGSPA
jgi:integrase